VYDAEMGFPGLIIDGTACVGVDGPLSSSESYEDMVVGEQNAIRRSGDLIARRVLYTFVYYTTKHAYNQPYILRDDHNTRWAHTIRSSPPNVKTIRDGHVPISSQINHSNSTPSPTASPTLHPSPPAPSSCATPSHIPHSDCTCSRSGAEVTQMGQGMVSYSAVASH